MLNVALTGNLASGKSTVLRHFAEWGASVIDADELVREVQRPGTPTLAAIARRFGRGVLGPDGALDRDALRAAALKDDEALGALNAIVHPAVARRRAELAEEARARGDCVLVNDIPLLFEVLSPEDFDLIVLVDAPPALRRERAVVQRGFTPEDADRMMAAQLPSDLKRDRSDIVIDNTGTPKELRRLAWDAWLTIRSRAARDAARGAGPLLAVLATPRDVVFAIGGTLARYSDAGVGTHVVCISGTMDELAHLLGLDSARCLEGAEGASELDDGAAIEAIADLVRGLAPAAVITYGPEGMTGGPLETTVHRWVIAAAQRAVPRLYYVTMSAEEAARVSTDLRGARPGEIAARLDVRPWREVKTRAAQSLPPSTAAHWLGSADATRIPDREWFTAPTTPKRPLADLFEGAA